MRQRLGQHFLKNPAVADALAAALELKTGDIVVEIGPGHGELTQALAATGADVVAMEKDPALAEEAQKRFRDNPRVKILNADAIKDLQPTTHNLLPNYKLAGNLPYYITGHLLRAVSELEHKPELAAFLIQKEVAERLTAKPPRMNRLAAAVQFWAEPRIIRTVGRREFSPPPEVDSAIVLLRSREQGQDGASAPDAAVFYKTVRVLFAQPRKTVLNNLKDGLAGENMRPEAAVELLKLCDIDPQARPQNLELAMIESLANEVDKIA